MRSTIAFVLFAASFVLAFSSTTQAQEIIDPVEVTESDVIPVDTNEIQQVYDLVRSEETRGYLTRRVYDSGGVQIVFRYEGRRYTMYASHVSDFDFLSIWYRPDGTSDDDSKETWSDHGLDGIVDDGGRGEPEGDLPPEVRQIMRREQDVGLEYLPHWQEMYTQAIGDALAQLH